MFSIEGHRGPICGTRPCFHWHHNMSRSIVLPGAHVLTDRQQHLTHQQVKTNLGNAKTAIAAIVAIAHESANRAACQVPFAPRHLA